MKLKFSRVALAVMIAAGFSVRAATRDVAMTYRMGAGFAGDVNRTRPMLITPALINTSVQSPRLYGDPVLIDASTNSVRGFVVGDTTTPTKIYGVAVRPYPTQQSSGGMSATLQTTGTGVAINTTQPLDVLEQGFIMVKVNSGTGSVTKGSAVYVWFAASSGAHVQGGFEGAATGGSTALISNARFNGPPDANGIAELEVWPA